MTSLATLPVTSAAPAAGPQRAAANASANGSIGTQSSQTSLSSLGATFMQLLTQELEHQDPTAPMDTNAMVGQMISLNQLDQVASINQLLTNTLGAGITTSGTGSGTTAAGNSLQAGAKLPGH